jgi:hypothetical protein
MAAPATVAGVYAQALLEVSAERGVRPAVVASCRELAQSLSQAALASLDDPRIGKVRAKDTLRAVLASEPKEVLDLLLLLIDRNRHVRRAVVPKVKVDQPDVVSSNRVVPFDFRQAAEWDEKGLITGTNLSNVQRMEELLGETIATLLADKGDAKQRKSPAVLVTVGIGFALNALNG